MLMMQPLNWKCHLCWRPSLVFSRFDSTATSAKCRHVQFAHGCSRPPAPACLTLACRRQRLRTRSNAEESFTGAWEIIQARSTHMWSADVIGIVWKYSWHVFTIPHAWLRVCCQGQRERSDGRRTARAHVCHLRWRNHDLGRLHVDALQDRSENNNLIMPTLFCSFRFSTRDYWVHNFRTAPVKLNIDNRVPRTPKLEESAGEVTWLDFDSILLYLLPDIV